MAVEKPSAEWSPEAVARRLKVSAAGADAWAQVFFDDSVPAENLSEAVGRAIREAAGRTGSAGSVTVGRIHKLAKSVSVRGDPDIIAELQNVSPVKAVLPSEVEDVLPKPVSVKVLE